MQRSDFFLSLILAVFSLIMLVWVIPSQSAPGEQYGLPPATMPMICAAGILVFSLILLLQNRPRKWAPKDEDKPPLTLKPLARTGLNFAIALICLLFMNVAGFVAGGIFVIGAGMLAAGQRSPLIISACSLGIPVLAYLLLRYGLMVSLP
ncbi:MAG: tripartite tricarboxylate transporter TctB family protein [Desulfarculaceae bacterium]|jgi:hypothetical protein